MSQFALSSPARFQTHDLAALIALYESNYVRLMRLAPDLTQIKGTVVSRVAGALDLFMSVDDRFKYTTTLKLTYCFRDGEEFALEPNARICVYHDVRCVELVSHCRRSRPREGIALAQTAHAGARSTMGNESLFAQMAAVLYPPGSSFSILYGKGDNGSRILVPRDQKRFDAFALCAGTRVSVNSVLALSVHKAIYSRCSSHD